MFGIRSATTLFSKAALPRAMSLMVGTTAALTAASTFKRPLLNDTFAPRTTVPDLGQHDIAMRVPVRERFNGKLNYRQCCIGSITGMVIGIIIGKLSTVLVFLTVGVGLGIEWLKHRGYINIGFIPLTMKLGSRTIDFNKMSENPSFKLSFLASFLVAAFNV